MNNGNGHLNKVAPVSKSVDPSDTLSSQPVQLQLASTASIWIIHLIFVALYAIIVIFDRH